MALFEGRNLACLRGERIVFRMLDFAIKPGDALLLVGANGSGKSSLLRLMSGLLRPAHGNILWDGEAIGEDPRAHASRLHYVGHLDGVKATMTVKENLQFAADIHGRAQPRAIDTALHHFAIAHLRDIPARMLSAGQRRRTALARLVASPAALWLLDEPTVSLDRASNRALSEAVVRHREAGGMAVIATHATLDIGEYATLEMTERTAMSADEWTDDWKGVTA